MNERLAQTQYLTECFGKMFPSLMDVEIFYNDKAETIRAVLFTELNSRTYLHTIGSDDCLYRFELMVDCNYVVIFPLMRED